MTYTVPWGTKQKSTILFNYLFHSSGLYPGLKSAKYLFRMHDKCSKALTVYKLRT